MAYQKRGLRVKFALHQRENTVQWRAAGRQQVSKVMGCLVPS